jgi:hypothetical protein
MDFISVLIGMAIGCLSTLAGIGIKILYFKLKPYLDTFKAIKGIEFDELYKNFIDDATKNVIDMDKKDEKK